MNSKIIISIIFYYFGLICSYGQNPIPTRDYQVDLENEAVKQYMRDVVYRPHDESLIDNYRKDLQYRGDWPNPVVMDIPQSSAYNLSIVCCDDITLQDSLTFNVYTTDNTVELYNLIPNRIYRYHIKDGNDILQQGKIYTSGQLRQIKVCNTVANVRDLGGWKTADNMQLRYGKLIRGTELNGNFIATDEGIDILRGLGIEAELDLRADYNEGHSISAFGFNRYSSEDYEIPTYYYSSDSGQLPSHMTDDTYLTKWRLEFKFIMKSLRKGRAIYEHCVYGKDRTGFLSFLLEGLLGVSYSDMVKDYELSFFIYKKESTKDSIDKVFDYIETMDGATLRDKFNSFFVEKLRIKQTDIDDFRNLMLEAIKPENQGDVNGDGEIKIDDVVAIINYIAGKTSEISAKAFDVNKDNTVNISDIIKVVNIIQGYR